MIKNLLSIISSLLLFISCATVEAVQPRTIEKIEGYTQITDNEINTEYVTDELNTITIGRQHTGKILCLSALKNSPFFYSAGIDGFISKHTITGDADTWQVSDIPVKKIVIHPSDNLIAIYETDGFSIHRVSVWDWSKKQRLYAKRFRDSVLSLDWSAQGTWLMIGTTSLEGLTILDGQTGAFKQVFKTSPGIVSLSATGASETTMITYGPSGKIIYTDVNAGITKATYTGISDIQNPLLFNNNRTIAGVVNGYIEQFDATSGKPLGSWEITNALAAVTNTDNEAVWFEELPDQLWSLNKATQTTFKSEFSLPTDGKITAALSFSGQYIIGLSTGELYAISENPENISSLNIIQIPQIKLNAIDDIASDGSRVFLLSQGALFISTGPGKSPVFAFDGLDSNVIKIASDSLIFASSDKTSPIISMSIDGDIKKVLYEPTGNITSLTVTDNFLVCIEGRNKAVVINMNTSKVYFTYSGIGLQDALLLDTTHLLVSKSSSMRSPNALLLVNCITGETAPLPVEAELIYGLKQLPQNKLELKGFRIITSTVTNTELVAIKINTTKISETFLTTIASFADEDLAASVLATSDGVLTNLGKGSLVEIKTGGGAQFRFSRGYSLPITVAVTDQFIVSLNKDGSLSWYNKATQKLISTAGITSEGFWIE